MAAFCNRLRGGRFAFRGRNIEVSPNRQGEPHPLHGQAWLAPWRGERLGQDRAEMRFLHERADWPWRYEAVQSVSASVDGVAIALEVRNLDDLPMPTGLGLHPCFPAGPGVRVRTQVSSVLLTDVETLATGRRAPASGAFDLSDRQIAGAGLDHGFAGWSGILDVVYPDHTIRVTASSDARWLQVYAPAGAEYFCAEPVTHANDAFAANESDWPELGVKVLNPGETLCLTLQITVLET